MIKYSFGFAVFIIAIITYWCTVLVVDLSCGVEVFSGVSLNLT